MTAGLEIARQFARDLNDTPIVTIDLEVMESNIRRMQALCDQLGVALRPHIKTHKIPDLALAQVAAGAKGITCQTIGEAEVMQRAGLDDILITYNIIGDTKLAKLRRLADRGNVIVTCDNETVARGLSEAFRDAPSPLGVLIECDTGAGRMGVQTPTQAAELAETINSLPGLRFMGLMTYPITDQTGPFLAETYKQLASRSLRAEIVSTGGTPHVSSLSQVPGVTEHRAGTYIFNDRYMVEKGFATWDDCAMKIRCTVVSRPTPDRAIIDGGTKTLSADTLGFDTFGWIVEYPDARIYRTNEEHGYVDLSACKKRPEVGEMINIIPNHTCVVANLHNELVGIRRGVVETSWRVAARGLVR